jgi:hypothetical protein
MIAYTLIDGINHTEDDVMKLTDFIKPMLGDVPKVTLTLHNSDSAAVGRDGLGRICWGRNFFDKIFCSFSQSVCYAYFGNDSCYYEISETFNKL